MVFIRTSSQVHTLRADRLDLTVLNIHKSEVLVDNREMAHYNNYERVVVRTVLVLSVKWEGRSAGVHYRTTSPDYTITQTLLRKP